MISHLARPCRTAILATAGMLLLAPVAQAEQDAILEMCIDANETVRTCECASEKLQEQIGAEPYAAYGRLGRNYLTGMAQDKSRADAWDDARAEEGLDLETTNEWGKAHLKAIGDCAR